MAYDFPLSRAMMRDEIRRKLNKVPLIDQTNILTDAGKPSPQYPNPTNRQIDATLDEATREINKLCQFHVNTTLTVPVVAVSSSIPGPLYIPINSLALSANAGLPGSINQIRKVSYSSPSVPLIPVPILAKSRQELDRLQIQYDQYTPGVPQYWWMEGYQLALSPAPASAGNLLIVAGTALCGFLSDEDTIDQIPADYNTVWITYAVVELAKRDTRNVEMVNIAQAYAPDKVTQLNDLVSWVMGNGSPEYQGRLGFDSYRTSSSSRRRRR